MVYFMTLFDWINADYAIENSFKNFPALITANWGMAAFLSFLSAEIKYSIPYFNVV